MSLLLTSALLASVATAQLTTSIWMPGAANANQSFVGSVVSLQNDRTTISMAFDGDAIETEYYGQGPDLVTVGGTTYVAYEATATDEESSVTVTVNLACSRADGSAVPTCTAATKIDGAAADTISGLESAASTTTMSGDEQYFLNNFKLVITAGTEKLSASAAATPTASGPTPTGSSAQSSGTSAASGASAASAASSAASSGVAQATGAAAPMRSLAPVLAGMGAAAAFFV